MYVVLRNKTTVGSGVDSDAAKTVTRNGKTVSLLDDCFLLVAVARLGQLVEPFFRAVAVLGVADVDPPPVQPERVNGAAGLDEQIDRVGQFELAAVGGLNEVAGARGCRDTQVVTVTNGSLLAIGSSRGVDSTTHISYHTRRAVWNSPAVGSL